MKLKELRTNAGQQKLFNTLVKWEIEQGSFSSLIELLSSTDAHDFIYEYIEGTVSKEEKDRIAEALRLFFIKLTLANNSNLLDAFNKAIFEHASDAFKFTMELPELNTTDKNQPTVINELLCAQFTNIKPTDVFLFPCAGRGSDAIYVCNTYGISKDNCFFIENNFRLCLRLISLGFKNVICGDILNNEVWTKLYNILKENNMQINKVLMNPPYDGTLHLEILDKVITTVRVANPKAEVVSIQPVGCFEDAGAEYKTSNARLKYKDILDRLSNLLIITRNDANEYFGITSRTNLGIYTFKPFGLETTQYILPEAFGSSILDKLLKTDSLKNHLSLDKGTYSIPVIIKFLCEADGRVTDKIIVADDGPIAKRGYVLHKDDASHDGWAWLNLNDADELTIMTQYLQSQFVKRIIKLVNSCRGTEKFIPIPPLDKLYSTEEYCDMFGLDEAEKAIMLRTDYEYIAPVVNLA